MRKQSIRAFLSVITVAMVLAFANGQMPPGGAAAPGNTKTAEQVFKNIQVLKAVPADQLIPAMQFITASLGVECSFCHVENHFDQDDKKPKQIARKMMEMMISINRDNFDGRRQVTCNTCHRGSTRPVSVPGISETATLPAISLMSEEEQLPPNLPSPDVLIEKYVQALGGRGAIQKVSSRIEKGSAIMGGPEVPVEVLDKAPAQRATIMHLPIGDNVTIFDGTQGWSVAPGHPMRGMPSSELEGARMDADLQFPLHLKEQYGTLQAARPEKIGDRNTYQLVALANNQPRLRLFFDQQSGLLVRLIRYADSPLGLNPIRIDYSDYRAVDDIKVPFRWTVAKPGGQFTIQATEVKQNVPLPPETFVRPAQPQPNPAK